MQKNYVVTWVRKDKNEDVQCTHFDIFEEAVSLYNQLADKNENEIVELSVFSTKEVLMYQIIKYFKDAMRIHKYISNTCKNHFSNNVTQKEQ